MKKLKDAVVKVGSYTNQQGETKGRFENVGVVMEGNDGSQFLLLKTTFNPAGCKVEGKDSIIINFYEPKGNEQQASTHDQAKQNAYQPESNSVDSDSIPF